MGVDVRNWRATEELVGNVTTKTFCIMSCTVSISDEKLLRDVVFLTDCIY